MDIPIQSILRHLMGNVAFTLHPINILLLEWNWESIPESNEEQKQDGL